MCVHVLSFVKFVTVLCISWCVGALGTSSAAPTVNLASFNNSAVVCWAHDLTVGAVSFFSHVPYLALFFCFKVNELIG